MITLVRHGVIAWFDGKISFTYRALKLGTFTAAAFDNILHANVSVSKLLFAFAGDAALFAVAAAVPIDAVAIGIRLGRGVGSAAFDGARPTLLSRSAARVA